MKKLSLILSFDYELPLGGCASYDRGLFHPAEQLLALSRRLDVPLVLFADVCSAIRFEEWDKERYYRPFVEQLMAFSDAGHDVQLHIHPHWFTSTFENGRVIPSEHFGLGEFERPDLPYSVGEIIAMAGGFLEETCRAADPDYRCIAYRAGGYNFDPHPATILQKLYAFGIRLESSVTKGFYLKATFNTVDQTECPPDPNWFIDLDADPTTAGESGLMEVPIAATTPRLPEQLAMRLRWRRDRDEIASKQYDHTGYSFPNPIPRRSLGDRWKMLMNPVRLSFDQGFYDASLLHRILSDTIWKYEAYDEPILSVVSHPKSMGTHQFQLMEDFIRRVREDYNGLVDLCTYRDVYDDRNLGSIA